MSSFFDDADQFFSKYVKEQGVLYREVKENPRSLDDLLSYVQANGKLEITNDTDKTLLITAYSLLVIKGIISEYPVRRFPARRFGSITTSAVLSFCLLVRSIQA